MATESKTPGFSDDKIVKTPEAEKVITCKVKPGGICLDGERIPAGITVKVSVKQWRVLSRHLEWVDGPKQHDPDNDQHILKAQKRVELNQTNGIDIGEIVKTAVAEALKQVGSGKAAAVALVIFLLTLLAPSAQAGVTVTSPPNGYGDVSSIWIPTNGAGGPAGLAANQALYWSPLTNSSGAITNVINATKIKRWVFGATGNTASTHGITNVFYIYGSGILSASNWDTNHPVAIITLSQTGSGAWANVWSNIDAGTYGYYCIGCVSNASGQDATTNLAAWAKSNGL